MAKNIEPLKALIKQDELALAMYKELHSIGAIIDVVYESKIKDLLTDLEDIRKEVIKEIES